MWQGINVDLGDASIEVTGSSLIEDADNAITMGAASPTVTALTNRINCHEAIFNSNGTGIHLSNLSVTTNSFMKAVNTIFSSRAIPSDFITWNNTAILKGTPSGSSPAPYNLCFSWPTRLACHDGTTPRTGVLLEAVGNTTGPAPAYSYSGIVLGDETSGTPDLNLYDAMGSGIEAHNSNLYVRNSSFMLTVPYAIPSLNPTTPPSTSLSSNRSIGVYADADATHKTELSVETIATSGVLMNSFYENRAGVEAFMPYKATVSRATFRSGNTSLALSGPGQRAITIHSADYDAIAASYNDIRNHVDGIWSNTLPGPGFMGNVRVLNNTIQYPYAASNYTNINTGIQIEQQGTIPYTGASSVQVNDNTITGMYNGITLRGIWGRKSAASRNTISMSASGQYAQNGILSENCANPTISNNYFVGCASTYATVGIGNKAITAIRCAGANNADVGCNSVANTGQGFEFAGTGASSWLDNTMGSHNRGFVLSSSAIGVQGMPVTDPAGNRWTGSYTYQTYVQGTFPAIQSRMYVNTAIGSNENPSLNIGFPTQSSYSSTGFPPTILPSILACGKAWMHVRCPSVSPWTSKGFALNGASLRTARNTLGDSIGISTWMQQLDLYSAIRADTSLMDTSAILHTFFSTASASRYEWLCALEDSVNAGNYSAVGAMIAAPPSGTVLTGTNCVKVVDSANGDGIVANYLAYYDLLLKWQANNFTVADSLTLDVLSQKCPLIDGEAVYKSRALRSLITGELLVYTDNCIGGTEEGEGGGGSGEGGSSARMALGHTNDALEQQYALLPNPNDGHMQLIQLFYDEQPVSLVVYNAVGQVIYQAVKAFESGRVQLDLGDKSPGLYQVVIRDNSGKVYSLQFIKK